MEPRTKIFTIAAILFVLALVGYLAEGEFGYLLR